MIVARSQLPVVAALMVGVLCLVGILWPGFFAVRSLIDAPVIAPALLDASALARTLLWSLADLADWMRVTPGFCGMHGNAFGLRKHDGFSGVMGVLVGLLGCFKVYLKCR